MGVNYKILVEDYDDQWKEIKLDYNYKLAEIRSNKIAQMMLINYITSCNERDAAIRLVPDSQWDTTDWNSIGDITCDILIDMFEDDWQPNYRFFNWIYKSFKEHSRLTELTKWMEKWDGDNNG